ncbi:MAG: lipoprotein [Methylococcales bacterium]
MRDFIKYCTLTLLIGLSVSGCGQKGDLFLEESELPEAIEKPVDTDQ